jgi:NADH:ubiquinone oxidoreductase subunit 6 (subunit J)
MSAAFWTNLLFWIFAVASVVSAWRVFRTDSMVRAAYWLLAAFAGVAGVLLLLGAEFLGLILLLMMAGEMTIMAVFMVMFMMNPAGLNPMTMVHQHRVSIAAGALAFLGLGAVALFGGFPSAPRGDAAQATAELGRELLGGSMLVFETAGATLLATMIGSLALASHRGRYGDAEAGSIEPALSPSSGGAPPPAGEEPEMDEHAGHDMGGMAMEDGPGAMSDAGSEPDQHTGHGGHA